VSPFVEALYNELLSLLPSFATKGEYENSRLLRTALLLGERSR
jgi:hypothetical protein